MRKWAVVIALVVTAVVLVAAVPVIFSGAKIDYPAAIMVDGTLYTIANPPQEVAVDETDVIGTVNSYTKKMPRRDGQTNFDQSKTSRYASVKDGIAVSHGERWLLYTEKDS